MVNYREILRLSALKHVQHDICSAMHCSDHTVRTVLKEAAKHNIHWPLDEDIASAELLVARCSGKVAENLRHGGRIATIYAIRCVDVSVLPKALDRFPFAAYAAVD